MKRANDYLTMIFYRQYPPSFSLQPFIECYWVLQSHSRFFREKEMVIPWGRTEMIFNFNQSIKWFGSDEFSAAISHGGWIIGQRDRYYYAQMDGDIDIFGIRFKHGGISRFIRMPISELKNELVPLSAVFPKISKEWKNTLSKFRSIEEKISFIEKKLLIQPVEFTKDHHLTLQAISYIKKAGSEEPIDTVCRNLGLYYKKLERIFERCAGYTPKNFSRIIRFSRAMRSLKFSTLSLTQIGYQCGYYDQSHFIRDCREFTGATPHFFLKEDHTIPSLLLHHSAV